MATVVFRGKAAIEGVAGAFDAILFSVQQTVKMTHNYEEEIIKDVHGYDAAWLARNEHATLDCTLKLLGDTFADAAIPATVVLAVGAVGGAAISTIGQPFLNPLSSVKLSGFAIGGTTTGINGTWTILSGFDCDLSNTKVGDLTLKLRKYADPTQNTAATSTPS